MSPASPAAGTWLHGKGQLGEDLNGYNGLRPVRDVPGMLGQSGRAALHRQLQRQLASALVDAERWHARRRSRRPRRISRSAASPSARIRARCGWARSSVTHNDNRNFSAKLASTASWQARRGRTSRRTVGADYTNIEKRRVDARAARILPPGRRRRQDRRRDECQHHARRPRRRRSATTSQEQASLARSPVPHGRRALRPEQRVRHELPARVLPEAQPVVD